MLRTLSGSFRSIVSHLSLGARSVPHPVFRSSPSLPGVIHSLSGAGSCSTRLLLDPRPRRAESGLCLFLEPRSSDHQPLLRGKHSAPQSLSSGRSIFSCPLPRRTLSFVNFGHPTLPLPFQLCSFGCSSFSGASLCSFGCSSSGQRSFSYLFLLVAAQSSLLSFFFGSSRALGFLPLFLGSFPLPLFCGLDALARSGTFSFVVEFGAFLPPFLSLQLLCDTRSLPFPGSLFLRLPVGPCPLRVAMSVSVSQDIVMLCLPPDPFVFCPSFFPLVSHDIAMLCLPPDPFVFCPSFFRPVATWHPPPLVSHDIAMLCLPPDPFIFCPSYFRPVATWHPPPPTSPPPPMIHPGLYLLRFSAGGFRFFRSFPNVFLFPSAVLLFAFLRLHLRAMALQSVRGCCARCVIHRNFMTVFLLFQLGMKILPLHLNV